MISPINDDENYDYKLDNNIILSGDDDDTEEEESTLSQDTIINEMKDRSLSCDSFQSENTIVQIIDEATLYKENIFHSLPEDIVPFCEENIILPALPEYDTTSNSS